MVDLIKDLGKERGMSLNDIERACAIGTNTIYKWDKASPSVDKLARVADYFGVSIDSILSHKEQTMSQADIALLQDYHALNGENRALLDSLLQRLLSLQK